ncbi:MAG TPA: replicative DNA helicase, partial [Sutterella sp.]|nr:replicative DNA helicase [Sutterella sp.]
DIVKAEDFYQPNLRRIYEQLATMINAGKVADPVTVNNEMTAIGIADNSTLGFLISLMNNVPLAANARRYAEIIHDKSVLCQLIRAGHTIADTAFHTEGRSTIDIVDEAEQRVLEISQKNDKEGTGLRPIREALTKVNDQVARLYNAKSRDLVTGTATGFIDLDRLTKGMHEGELIVVAGRPSMGKTTFALNIAENVALRSGLPVAVFSLEMPADQLALRLISSLKRIPLTNLRDGRLKDDEFQRMGEAVREIADSRNIFIDDSAGRVSEIRSRARRLAREVRHLGLIVIDYIQLIGGETRTDNRAMEISEISRSLKLLAKELKCPIVVLSQLNRDVDKRTDKRPMMSDLRESGAIEQDADVIIFLYREVVYDESLKGTDKERDAEAILRKQRNGPIGTVNLTFFGEYTHFKSRAND